MKPATMLPDSTSRSRPNFTMTELGVCVCIVFLLGWFFYPWYYSQSQKVDATRELSNQKRLGLAFLMYAQDYDERFPPAVAYVSFPKNPQASYSPETRFLQSWGPDRILSEERIVPGLLSPYLKDFTNIHKNNEVYLCPFAQPRSQKRILEYMYNDLIAAQQSDSVKEPSRTVLITSAEDRLENAGHALTPNSGPFVATFNAKGGCDAGQGASVRTARLRTNKGAAFTFADGHARWFKGGADDVIFFPPRSSAGRTAFDPKTKKQIGPKPGRDMIFAGRHYDGTFHLR